MNSSASETVRMPPEERLSLSMLNAVRLADVTELCRAYPIYPQL